MKSFATIIPYSDHENALSQVVTDVEKDGMDWVDFSAMTFFKVDNGDPIKKIAEPTPTDPIKL